MTTKYPLPLAALAAVLTLLAADALFAAQLKVKKSIEEYLEQHYDKPYEKCQSLPSLVGPSSPLHRCSDGTLSYIQEDLGPGSGGICGQVAVANVLTNMCESADFTPLSVSALMRNYDGTNYTQRLRILNEVLAKGLECLGGKKFKANIAHPKHKRFCWIDETGDPLTVAWMVRKYPDQPKGSFIPVIATLRTEEQGHATTIVRIEERNDGDCIVVHNTWGRQYRTPASKFKKIAQEMLYITYDE